MSETLTEAAPAAEPAAPEVTPDGVAPDAGGTITAPAAPAQAQPWEDPAVLDLVDARAQALLEQRMAPIVPLLEQFLQSGGYEQGQQAAPGELNPWDESFGSSLDQRFQALEQRIGGMLQQVTAPLEARAQAETIQHGEERLKDILADDIARNGDFPADPSTGRSTAKDLVRPLADMFFPEFASKLGETPRAAELAMTRAAALVRTIVAESRNFAVNQETNRLTALANANSEPGVTGAGVETGTSGRPLGARELAMKYGNRANALRAT